MIPALFILLFTGTTISNSQETKNSPPAPALVTTERRIGLLDEPVPAFGDIEVLSVYTDPSQRHVAQVVRRDGHEWVILDGKPQHLFDSIVSYYVRPRGFALRLTGNEERLCSFEPSRPNHPPRSDFRSYRSPDGGLKVLFSPNGRRYAYIGKRGNNLFLVVDGSESGPYPDTKSVSIDNMTFASNGRFAYSITDRGEDKDSNARDVTRVFIDGLRPVECMYVFELEFSSEGKHVAFYAYHPDNSVSVCVDGIFHGKYDDYGYSACLAFSPNGRRLGYLGYRDGKCMLTVDGREYPAPNHVQSNVYFAIDHLIAVANGKRIACMGCDDDGSKDNVIFAVVDGRNGPRFEGVDTLLFSPNGLRFAYRGLSRDGAVAIIDGKQSTLYSDVEGLAFSPDSRHTLFAAERGEASFLVYDGKPSPETGGSISSIRFSPDSRRYACRVQGSQRESVRVFGDEPCEYAADWASVFHSRFRFHADDLRYAAEMRVAPNDPNLLFSPDSNHIAYVDESYKGRKRTWAVGIDGVFGDRCDARPSGGSLYWVNSTTLRTIAIRGREILEVTIRITTPR